MHALGSKIYYTGDQANQPGWFEVVGHRLQGVDLKEIDGTRKFLGVFRAAIGDKYYGHCNPRFVTEAAHKAWKAKRAAEAQAIYDALTKEG